MTFSFCFPIQVRNALEEAERQIESGGMWVPPQELLHWLDVTHEMEAKFHTIKRQAAERQLRDAKDVVSRLKQL